MMRMVEMHQRPLHQKLKRVAKRRQELLSGGPKLRQKRRLKLLSGGPKAALSAGMLYGDVHSAVGGLKTVHMATPSVEIELC